MERKVNLDKAFHFEDSVVLCGIHNAEIIGKLINTSEKIHNKTIWTKRLFAGIISRMSCTLC